MGFSQSVVLRIVLTVSSVLCLTGCFYQRGWQIVGYELNVCVCLCEWMIEIVFVPTDGMACIAYTVILGFSVLKGVLYIICFLRVYV